MALLDSISADFNHIDIDKILVDIKSVAKIAHNATKNYSLPRGALERPRAPEVPYTNLLEVKSEYSPLFPEVYGEEDYVSILMLRYNNYYFRPCFIAAYVFFVGEVEK